MARCPRREGLRTGGCGGPVRAPAARGARRGKERRPRTCRGGAAPLCWLPPAALSTFSTPERMRALRVTTLACLVVPAACGSGGNAGARQPGSHQTSLVYYETYDPRSLDPALSTDVPTGEMVALVYDGLTQFDPDGKLLPSLADHSSVFHTCSRYVFHLRAGVRFHDGTRVTPGAVRQSLLRVLAPGTRGGPAWPLYAIAG